MMATDITNNKTNKLMSNGKMDVAGLELNIASALGGAILDNYYQTLTKEDKELIFNEIENEIFENRRVYDNQTGKYNDKKYFRKTIMTSGWNKHEEEAFNSWDVDSMVIWKPELLIPVDYKDLPRWAKTNIKKMEEV